MGSGVLAWVHPKSAPGWKGQAQLGLLSVVPCRRVPAAPGGKQVDSSKGWIHRSTALGVCVVEASLVTGTGSIREFGWGWEREMAVARAFVPRELNSVCRGSTTLPLGVFLPSPLAESRAVDF